MIISTVIGKKQVILGYSLEAHTQPHFIMTRRLVVLVVTSLMTLVRPGEGHESVGLTFELENNEKTCFYQDFKKLKRFTFSFQVLRGGLRDIDVTVESPAKKVVFQTERAVTDSFDFESSWGLYSFCFSNEFPSVIHKIVYFELRPEEHRPLAVEAGIKRPSANTQIEETMEDLHRLSSDVINFQRQYRLKEAQGRYLAESINKGVFWYSFLQSIIIFIVMTTQVFVLKCFFTHHRKSTALNENEDSIIHHQQVA